MKLNVNEIFRAIQGEGKYVGTNVVFLRLSGCNLGCTWCDTKYHKERKEMTLEEVANKIYEFKSNRIVVTGGEPLLQQDSLEKLFEILDIDHDYHITIETNGTIVPEYQMKARVNHWACSPKLSGSGNNLDKRINYDALQAINRMEDSAFKFVISSDADLDEVKFLEEQVPLKKDKIYLMKEGATTKEQFHGIVNFLEVCKNKGYHYSPRLHVMIYDNLRGV
ncbi:MAG: 7-carboxy-7-deazaguanine synthase QueE [Candidatus Pacearchaeota archaeon]|jgi:organic radical activating enzyme